MKHLYFFIIAILFATNILAQTDSVTDIDGNIYPTIEIGNQIWMAEDLRVTNYPNGDPIPNVTVNSSWSSLTDNDSADAYSFYNNNSNTDYGAVYTYAAAIGDNWQRDSVKGQGICPCGWHLPTDTEWTELINHLEGTSVAGGKIRESGTTHWSSPNTGATNESGFTALPGGFRDYNCGAHGYLGSYAGWWTANEYTAYPTLAFRYLTNTNSASIDRSFNNKSYGFSVRCVKNEMITHTVIFLDWDGSGIDTVQVENGSDATPPNDPIREGYIFTDWDTEYTNVTQDLIITAQHSIIDYNINYELDGGTNSINNPATYTIEENIIFDVATKEGYSFDGWFTTNDFQNGTEVAEISQGSTGNVEIWAKFTLTTGINNADANKLTLYPNPVIDGVLNIDCYETINEIKIFDLSGTLILRQTINNKQSHSINIYYLKSGVYFVKIEEKVFRIIKD